MKKSLIITLIINLIIIGSLYIILNISKQNEYNCIFSYYEDYIPGRTHEFCMDNNLNFVYKIQPSCSTPECIEGIYYPSPEIKKFNIVILSIVSFLVVIIINAVKQKKQKYNCQKEK